MENMEKAENTAGLKFYTTNEIAEMLKMNVQVIARKLQYGQLPGYKIGKDWRISETDLMAWLGKHSNQESPSERDKVIGRFMKDGRFDVFPVQYKKRKYIIEYILQQFEPNRIYAEKEINEIIGRFHDDYCRVRRDFVDEKMMYRKDGKYRRNASYRITKD
jgi:excisionase family DNA binding protein